MIKEYRHDKVNIYPHGTNIYKICKVELLNNPPKLKNLLIKKNKLHDTLINILISKKKKNDKYLYEKVGHMRLWREYLHQKLQKSEKSTYIKKSKSLKTLEWVFTAKTKIKSNLLQYMYRNFFSINTM